MQRCITEIKIFHENQGAGKHGSKFIKDSNPGLWSSIGMQSPRKYLQMNTEYN